MDKGTLYIVATPIGNMNDITLRALETFKSTDIIYAEDTREISKILKANNINTPVIPYTDQKHDRLIAEALTVVESGKNISLVSDNGTPLISDPGYKLVRDFIEKGIKVTAIPGPSAIVAALSISGLPTDKFVFLGFAPKKSGERKNILDSYGSLDATLVFYESPIRVISFLEEIFSTLGDRKVCLAKDLTKMFEFVNNGRLSYLLAHKDLIKEKGEYVVMIAKEGI